MWRRSAPPASCAWASLPPSSSPSGWWREAGFFIPDVAVQVRAAQITLATIFCSGAIVYLLVKSGLWRPWLAYVTVSVDVIVVVANAAVSTFHYRIGPEFLFAFPGVMTFGLVLAVSALRFRPAVQLYALALLSLSLLVALFALPGSTLLERAAQAGRLAFIFADPPNGIRLVMIMLTGAVLVLLTMRVRALLRDALRDSMRSVQLSRFVSGEVAKAVDTYRMEELRQGLRAPAAVLFADIRGSTALGEDLPPDRFAALIGRYRAIVCEVVAEHGGFVDKFVGDGAMVIFGGLQPKPDDAARALRAAVALDARLRQELQHEGAAVPVGMGLHHGEVFAGLIGDDSRQEITLMGDTVNVASRLEQATRDTPHRLLVSGELLAAAGADLAHWPLVDRRPLRGRDGEVAVHAPA
jgi:adenylate cyclase